nr:retrovirus-related Pol polyprotein from transposon TNT 1-94 [Tanacetum cinerariifolium]
MRIRSSDRLLSFPGGFPLGMVPVGKSNCYLDMEKSQGNPIYKITVDLLKNTNFFRAFTASSTIPSIYIQQFWDTIQYDKTVGCFRCQLDEQLFVLTKDTLREALQITPVNSNQAFIYPPTVEALINFVNELGYPKLVRHVSNVVTNDMFQPWRALITIINLCLTGKTYGFERPRAPVLQILWGIVKRANIDYAERIWEEFTQSIHTFIEDKRNLFHPKPDSALHLPNEEPVLGYLKFSAKGTKKEVFGMPIPGSLITAEIQEASYYQEYLAKVAQHKRPAVTSTQPAPSSAPAEPQAKKRKQATETSDKPLKAKKSKYVAAEDAELQKFLEEIMKTAYALPRGPLPPVVIREPESEKYQPLPEVPEKGKAKVSEEQSDSEEESEKVVLEATEGGNDEDQAGPDPGAQAESQMGTDAGTLDEGQAGSNPDELSEGQAGPGPGNAGYEEQSILSPVVHAGSDREHMDLDVADESPQPSTEQLDEGFTATAHPKVQENLKLAVEERVLPSGAPGASGSSQVPPPPPPPPPSTSQESLSKGFVAPSPSKIAASAEYQAWTTTDVRLSLHPTFTLSLKPPLYLRSQYPSIAICCNSIQHSRAKHIDVRYHFIKEQVENRIVELYFVRTEYQLADIFTKPLPRKRFNFLIENLEIKSMSLDTLKRLVEETDE